MISIIQVAARFLQDSKVARLQVLPKSYTPFSVRSAAYKPANPLPYSYASNAAANSVSWHILGIQDGRHECLTGVLDLLTSVDVSVAYYPFFSLHRQSFNSLLFGGGMNMFSVIITINLHRCTSDQNGTLHAYSALHIRNQSVP